MDKDIWSKWQVGDCPIHQMLVELEEVVRYYNCFGCSLVFDCTKVWLKILMHYFLQPDRNRKLEGYPLLEWYHPCLH